MGKIEIYVISESKNLSKGKKKGKTAKWNKILGKQGRIHGTRCA